MTDGSLLHAMAADDNFGVRPRGPAREQVSAMTADGNFGVRLRAPAARQEIVTVREPFGRAARFCVAGVAAARGWRSGAIRNLIMRCAPIVCAVLLVLPLFV
jgi:hypothetical protein